MARPGPTPKSAKHSSANNNWIDIPNVPYTGPGSERDLPDTPGMAWFPQTESWWEVVRQMPHCIRWEASDWLFAIHTAYCLNQWWSEFFGGVVHGTATTELRRREDQMGTTMEARRKLGIRYVAPKTGVEAPPEEQAEAAGSNSVTDDPGPNVKDISDAPSRRSRLAG